MEHLSAKNSQDFINTKLLDSWTAQKFHTNKIFYPVSEYIVPRWMKGVDFKYKKREKSYYVDRHKDEDVVSDHTAYLQRFSRNK